MAILLRGMTPEETAWLTDAMVRSGVRVDYPDVDGIPVDKHSTGGVGDKTSLILAPLAVACGAVVPMMSGRGLGHTGGTLDKLESIPGFRTDLSLDELRRRDRTIGCALIGQTVRDRAGRPQALRPARRDRDGREHPADLGVDHEQEDRRGDRRPGARREDRQRRVHEDAGRFARAGALAGGDRRGVRRPHRGADHRDGRAARHARSATRSKSSSARDAQGARARATRASCRCCSPPACSSSPASNRTSADGESRGSARRSRRGAGLEVFRAHHREPGRRSARGGRLSRCCRSRPDEHRVTAPRGRLTSALEAESDRPRRGRARRRARDAWTDVVDPGVGIEIVASARHARSAPVTRSCSSAIAPARPLDMPRPLLADAACSITEAAAVRRGRSSWKGSRMAERRDAATRHVAAAGRGGAWRWGSAAAVFLLRDSISPRAAGARRDRRLHCRSSRPSRATCRPSTGGRSAGAWRCRSASRCFILKFEVGGVRPATSFPEDRARRRSSSSPSRTPARSSSSGRWPIPATVGERASARATASSSPSRRCRRSSSSRRSSPSSTTSASCSSSSASSRARCSSRCGRSGAETLSAAANVFMGQTEAPIIVKPYVPGMTQSELLAMMVGGMATISGGVMAVYIALGADPVAILTTSRHGGPVRAVPVEDPLPGDGRAGDPRRRQGRGRADARQRHRRRRPPARRTARCWRSTSPRC